MPSDGLAGTDELIDILILFSDVGKRRLSEQAADLLQLNALDEVEEGGISGRLGELKIPGTTAASVNA